MFPAQVTAGDLFGFAAVVLAGLSAFFMVIRGKLLKLTKNLGAIRALHVVVSALAGIFIILHVAYFFSYPISAGVLLGYAAFAVSLVVWLTGTAFLEKVRDSLVFHSSFSIVFVSLALIHAAASSVNIPSLFSDVMIAGSVIVLVANAAYQLSKMGVGTARAENRRKEAKQV
jgi:hypothetical protein